MIRRTARLRLFFHALSLFGNQNIDARYICCRQSCANSENGTALLTRFYLSASNSMTLPTLSLDRDNRLGKAALD